MKLYRVQVKYKNIYIDETLEAENDKAALDCLVKKVESGDVIEKDGQRKRWNRVELQLT